MKKTFANVTTDIEDDFSLAKYVTDDYDTGAESRVLWGKETYKCELDDKEIEFKLCVQVEDLYGLCGDDSAKGQVDIEVLLVPLAKCCTQKTLDKANNGDGAATTEQDLLDYGCYVVMARELLKGIDGDEPLDSQLVVDKVKVAAKCLQFYGGTCGFYLDRYQNRIGSTGWDYLNEWCSDIDSCKAALDRWKAEQK